MNNLDLLIQVLLDESASLADRDDAAIDLRRYDSIEALQALVSVASDPSTDPFILDVCGESIAAIWARKGNFSLKSFSSLLPIARYEAKEYLKIKKPEWLNEHGII